MRTISIIAFTSFLLLWGVYFYLKDSSKSTVQTADSKALSIAPNQGGTILSAKRKHELDQIGAVINAKTVRLDDDKKEEIRVAKKGYDKKEGVKELQTLLEQSYLDHNGSLKDIKRIQNEIVELKNKLKEDVSNTEKWDPRFVYYLMIQENYTYPEVNMIKSLAENGLNMEEIEYINELIRENTFLERITAFKAQGADIRKVASTKTNKKKIKDDFIDDVNAETASIEDKLIEMNYNQAEKEEMIYGNNQ